MPLNKIRKMRTTIFILAVILAMPALGQKRGKTDGSAVPAFHEGIVYALPRTGLNIKVKAVKETFEPGPYAAYAEQLLGIKDVRTRASVRWYFDNVELESFSEPDPNQVYKATGDAAFRVALTQSGILAGINTTSGDDGQIVLKANNLTAKVKKNDGFSFANINSEPYIVQGDSSNNYRSVRVSTDRKAAEAAERILECRVNRYHTVAGMLDEFHPDGEAYKISLQELDNIEKEYMSLFAGRTTYETQEFSFDFVPVSSSDRGEVVFRFSEDAGVLPASDLSGKPVNIKVEPDKELVSKFSGLSKSENPVAGESGIYYRMPAVANVSIVYEINTIATARTVLPQFGQIAPLPEELLYGEYSIEFHPETGAVKSVRKK